MENNTKIVIGLFLIISLIGVGFFLVNTDFSNEPIIIKGEKGEQGIQGLNGTNGINGVNGTNGINGVNGTNGINGVNGTNWVIQRYYPVWLNVTWGLYIRIFDRQTQDYATDWIFICNEMKSINQFYVTNDDKLFLEILYKDQNDGALYLNFVCFDLPDMNDSIIGWHTLFVNPDTPQT